MDELEGSVEPEEVTLTDASAESVVDDVDAAVEGSDVATEAVAEESLDDAADGDETLTSLKDRLTPEDYEYVVGVRKEAQGYRQERNEFKDAFEGFEKEDVDVFLQAVRLLQTDPKAAHGAFSNLVAEIAKVAGISEEAAAELVEEELNNEVVDEDDEDGDTLITKKDLAVFLAQQEADKAAAAAQKAEDDARATVQKEVDAQIAELGYKPDTKGFNDLMYFANSITEGSVSDKLAQAHKMIQDERQAVIDSFLKDNEALSDIAPSQSDGAAPTPVRNEDYKKSIKSGASAAREFLDATYSDDDE